MGPSEQELGGLYKKHGPPIFRRCRRILCDDALADDAVQEVFMRVMRYGIDRGRKASSLLGWFNRVADRVCFDMLKKRRNDRPSPTGSNTDEPASVADSPEQRFSDREIVMQFLARLDRRTRWVAVHYYVDELDQQEIATRLGCTRKTVYNKLQLIERRRQNFLCGLRNT